METDALSKWQGWGIPVLRAVVAVVFLAHGVQKLFVWGFGNVAAFLSRFGIPAPMLAAVIVTLVEFLGGLMLILGLYTRWAAAPLAIDMLVTILTVHLRNGFFLPSGFEFPLTLLAATGALDLLGSGEASVDAVFQTRQT